MAPPASCASGAGPAGGMGASQRLEEVREVVSQQRVREGELLERVARLEEALAAERAGHDAERQKLGFVSDKVRLCACICQHLYAA
jgi:hypothetical protein